MSLLTPWFPENDYSTRLSQFIWSKSLLDVISTVNHFQRLWNIEFQDGQKIVAIVDIKWSSNQNIDQLQKNIVLMTRCAELFENLYDDFNFRILTPTLAWDDLIISVLWDVPHDKWIELIQFYLEVIRQFWIDVNSYVDLCEVKNEHFIQLETKHFSTYTNVWWLYEFFSKFVYYHKISWFQSIYSDKICKILNQNHQDSYWLTDNMLNDFLENKSLQSDIKMYEIISRYKIGKVLLDICNQNALWYEKIFQLHNTEADSIVIFSWQKNEYLYFFEWESYCIFNNGRVKEIQSWVTGEASLLTWWSKVANASIVFKEWTQYVKIPHELVEAILFHKKFDWKKIKCYPEQAELIKNTLSRLNAWRITENINAA
jgi:hypothetical protein